MSSCRFSPLAKCNGRGLFRNAAFVFIASCLGLAGVQAQPASPPSGSEAAPPPGEMPPGEEAAPEPLLYIKQYRVVGAKILPRADVDEAVYNYLGPGRTVSDVEQARAALEKAYKDKGYQTVSVTIPPQRGDRGIIFLQVTEATVGRLRVRGSRYFNIEAIKKQADSLAEGTVPDFNKVQQDLVELNRSADMQVTPSIQPGVVPGTYDVELIVKDKLPLHGSVELNNRYSANTTPLRLNLDLRYSNLWNLGHTVGFGFQVAPQRVSDALVYSAYYIAPIPAVNWLSLMLQGIRQNSDVSTLGGTTVAGNGEIYGGRLMVELPSRRGFYQSASFGVDYKHFTQDLTLGEELVGSPVTYWPFTASYTGAWIGKGRETELNAAIVFHLRGMGSTEVEFDNRRYAADGNFFYFRGSAAHTQDLPWNFQLFGELQGQASAEALLDTEQFALGGLSTVRGYLEAAVLGDSAIAGTLELRTPSLLEWAGEGNEMRLFTFLDAGAAWLNEPLPEQVSQFNLWSYGVGGTIKLFEHARGSLALGIPMVTQGTNTAGHPLFTFRIWGEL